MIVMKDVLLCKSPDKYSYISWSSNIKIYMILSWFDFKYVNMHFQSVQSVL